MEYHEFRAMNSDILLAAEGEAARVARGFEQAQAFIEKSEQRFTRFSEESELAELNRNSGRWQPVSTDLFDLLSLACRYNDTTQGLFNPAILPALEQAGYDRSMDEIRASGAHPPKPEPKSPVPDFRTLRMDVTTRQVRLPSGMQIDLGGIAKGWIAERAAQLLSSFSSSCAVNAGGDMTLVGLPSGETAWPVELEDPRDPSRTLAILNVGPGAIATSSTAKRSWSQNGRRRHHLIDPRTGEPARVDWLSVTVIASRAATAEVFAKALLIAGSQEAETIAAGHNEIAFIAVDSNGDLWGSKNSQEYLYVANEILSR